MDSVADNYVAILEKERECALRADVDALGVVQEEKRKALTLLLEQQPSEDDLTYIRAQSYENVRLIRHLVTCLHGILAPDGATYNAEGAIPVAAGGRSRGRL
ncbi:MAG: hypothetical protein RL385_5893 [Pseudomonadota bacterium]|jgi:hypothetical protein